MVTIKEAELLTGITRQNIRYYEKMGLIHPSREKENQYRKYNKEDIRRLKLIYMFRKLDMPLEEIQQILDGRKDLQEALEQQKEQLRQKQQNNIVTNGGGDYISAHDPSVYHRSASFTFLIIISEECPPCKQTDTCLHGT